MRIGTAWLGVVVATQFLLCAGAAAAAQDRQRGLQASGGIFNVGKTPAQAVVGLELRRPIRWWRLDLAGGIAATDEGSFWAYLGLRRDFPFGDRLVIAPGLSMAGYERGDGKDLGGSIQFRSALEVGYRMTGRSRVGLTMYHLSNAGLEKPNPGANSVVVSYAYSLP